LFYIWMARRYFGVLCKQLCVWFVYFCIVTTFVASFDASGTFQTLFSGIVIVKTKDDFGFIDGGRVESGELDNNDEVNIALNNDELDTAPLMYTNAV